MNTLRRDPESAAQETYDLIIIGGGIYGTMLSYEASKRRLKSLVIEQDDFGSKTSFNSLRIIHGGLRYLQSLDLHRYVESVRERSWFLRAFPDLISPLPCLMPLYGKGLRRMPVFRLALKVNDLLSLNRNRGIQDHNKLLPGKVVGPEKTLEIFPMAVPTGLEGGAIWHDAALPDSQLLVMTLLKAGSGMGASALNYMEADRVLTAQNRVTGIQALDRETGRRFTFKSRTIVNAAGPWCRHVAAMAGRDEKNLFIPSLAWNMLLNKEALSDHALALTPGLSGNTTYFVTPWKGKILAGTGHAPWLCATREAGLSHRQIHWFLDEINRAVPGLHASFNDIHGLFPGLLPTTQAGSTTLKCRETIMDHSKHGGPGGIYSVSGVKFTTSRRVAEKTLNLIFPGKAKRVDNAFTKALLNAEQKRAYDLTAQLTNPDLLKTVDHLRNESVMHLQDLLLRRTTLWESPGLAIKAASAVSTALGWDGLRKAAEFNCLDNGPGMDR